MLASSLSFCTEQRSGKLVVLLQTLARKWVIGRSTDRVLFCITDWCASLANLLFIIYLTREKI